MDPFVSGILKDWGMEHVIALFKCKYSQCVDNLKIKICFLVKKFVFTFLFNLLIFVIK